MNKWGKYIISYGSAFLISLLGLVLHLTVSNDTVIITLSVLSCIPILLLVANLVLSKLYIRKINRTKVADMQGYMLLHRDKAEKTSHKLLKDLKKLRGTTTLYTVLLWLLAACVSLLGGMLSVIESWLLYPMTLYAGTIFYVICARIYPKKPITLNSDAPILQRDEYPNIYRIATRAAQELGCHNDVTILIAPDCNAGIWDDGNKYYVQLGIVLLNILSQEELFCVFLHEFSHCSKKNQSTKREMQYGEWISSDKNLSGFMSFVENLFRALDLHYLFHHMTYQYATSVLQETAADCDMVKFGTPSAAGSSLLKLEYYSKYSWERNVKNEVSDYIHETPNPHYLRTKIEHFKNAIESCHSVWDTMVQNEILANNATHPTLKMRLETLGLQQIEITEDKSSEDYQREVQTALDFADKKLLENQNTYEQDRKESYLEPLRRITEWEEQDKPIHAENYADIISDLKQIGRHEDAEALCDRAIQELSENSSQYAYYMKGCALIHRYDKSGVDYIYHAIEKNNNFLEEGLHQIGTFYCMTGMEAELLDYRQRAQQFAQKNKDEYSETGFLSTKDTLSRDDMPANMLNEILTYIHSIDEDIIQNIYLVRKTISATFFTSVFIIHFYGGTDAQRNEIMHKIFSYLDTYPVEWQFSLFDYFDYPNIKFNKIEGSLVYSKISSKGEKQ